MDKDYLAWLRWCREKHARMVEMYTDEIQRHLDWEPKTFRCDCNDYCPCDFHYNFPKGN